VMQDGSHYQIHARFTPHNRARARLTWASVEEDPPEDQQAVRLPYRARALEGCLKAAGITQRFTPHGLRRTVNRMLRRAQVDPVTARVTALVSLQAARRGGAGRQVYRIGVRGELYPRLAPRDAATTLG
jgi:integrase